jgi:penicillin-binding protein 2
MAAALKATCTRGNHYFCGSYFEELPGERFKDWTVDGNYRSSGTLTLVQGLMRSCNPGSITSAGPLQAEGATYLPDMARGLDSAPRQVLNRWLEMKARSLIQIRRRRHQQGIGQAICWSPLQVARFTAAVANGGTLYRPQMIEAITNSAGESVLSFAPESNGTLPVSQETLDAIREGMRAVVRAKNGTANFQLGDLGIPIFGKTGTAENPMGDSHAWFTGFTETPRTDRPDIAVAVIVENAGQGSEVLAS